ncbi:MAG: formylglycine-generating enzyme family protein [Puniceicoccaceae bacterium]
MIFLVAVTAATAVIFIAISATNEEIIETVKREAALPPPESELFVPTESSEPSSARLEDSESTPAEASITTDPTEALTLPPATEPAVPPSPSKQIPTVETEIIETVSRDLKSEAETLKAEVDQIYNLATQANASSHAFADFRRGSALKTAAQEAYDEGDYEQTITLLKRSKGALSTAAFTAELTLFERGIEEAGLGGLRESPTPQWIRVEAEIELAGENPTAGSTTARIESIQSLRRSIPELKADTLKIWLASARESSDANRREVAIRMFKNVLKIDPKNTEAKNYLFRNAYEPGVTLTNTVGMQFAYIPPGTFIMGTPKNEAFRDNDEIQREVTLTRGYFIGVHEVTQENWREVMNEPTAARVSDPRFFGPKLPVHSVSWEDAVEFCRRLSNREGRVYRLPTEAEWEYAARGGTTTPYNNGQINLTSRDANVYDPSGTGPRAPLAVGVAGNANSYGLYDIHGNVWEWIADWSGPYDLDDLTDPKGVPEDQLPTRDLAMRVVRGGSYIDDAHLARSGNRWEYSPAAGTEFIGFRILLEVDSF